MNGTVLCMYVCTSTYCQYKQSMYVYFKSFYCSEAEGYLIVRMASLFYIHIFTNHDSIPSQFSIIIIRMYCTVLCSALLCSDLI